MQEARSGQVVRWADVQDAYVRRRRSIFDEHHELVIVTRQADRRETSLDGLTMPWERIVSLLEERLDREVPVRGERASLR